jgi:hypothetical protein
MTTTVEDAQAAERDAELTVAEAEADIASGKRSISAATLHELRDGWRHTELATKNARQRVEQERREARMSGLAAIGAEVDKLAQPERGERLASALRDVAAACARVRAASDAHDADFADRGAGATDLGAELAAPGGPRSTSAYIAVRGTSIIHKRVTVSPLGARIHAALGYAINGDPGRAAAAVQAVTQAGEPKRPDHLLRNPAGVLFPIQGPLSDSMSSQIRTGNLARLSEHEISLYMAGELA